MILTTDGKIFLIMASKEKKFPNKRKRIRDNFHLWGSVFDRFCEQYIPHMVQIHLTDGPDEASDRDKIRVGGRIRIARKILKRLIERRKVLAKCRCCILAEHGAQGMVSVVLRETSQPPPKALINWTLAVICCIRRFIAVR